MPRIVVSLSTIPSRVPDLEATLVTLAVQTRKPDAIYVSIPRRSVRENADYPIKDIAKLIKKLLPGVGRIVLLDEDYGPLTKLMGPLLHEKDPGTLIITVDDDQKYDMRLVETLFKGSLAHEGSVVCLCGHVIGEFPTGRWGYRCARGNDGKWPLKTVFLDPHSEVNVVSGWCGVLYPRGVFGDEVPNRFMEGLRKGKGKIPLLHKHDDLYISAWLDVLGVKKYVVAYDGAHDDKMLAHGFRNALSVGNNGPTPGAGIRLAREFWQVIGEFRARGILVENIRVKWYKSTVTLAAMAAAVTVATIAGAAVWAYKGNKK